MFVVEYTPKDARNKSNVSNAQKLGFPLVWFLLNLAIKESSMVSDLTFNCLLYVWSFGQYSSVCQCLIPSSVSNECAQV